MLPRACLLASYHLTFEFKSLYVKRRGILSFWIHTAYPGADHLSLSSPVSEDGNHFYILIYLAAHQPQELAASAWCLERSRGGAEPLLDA